MSNGESDSLDSNAAAHQLTDPEQMTDSHQRVESAAYGDAEHMEASGRPDAAKEAVSDIEAEESQRLGGGDEDALSYSYDGEAMEEVEEEEVMQEPRVSPPERETNAGGDRPLTGALPQAPAGRNAEQRTGLQSGGVESHQRKHQKQARHVRQEMQGQDRYGPGGARSSGMPAGMGPRPMGAFPQMMPGMMGGMPTMHGRPMTRDEFQQLQAMGGMGPGMGSMGGGLPLMYGGDPGALARMLAIQGLRIPYDPMGGMSPSNSSGPGPSHRLLPDPPHLRGNMARPGNENSGSDQGTSNGNGTNPRSRIIIPSPHKPPPPRGPPPPAARPGSALNHGGYQYSAQGGITPGIPANPRAQHVWERDAHVGGLPPPAGYKGAAAAQPLPRSRPTAEEQAKIVADLELKRLSMRVAQLARENARQAAVLAKQEEKNRQEQEMNRKKESLVAEMAEMRRKIAIQELRQAGQPIPAELLVPYEQQSTPATTAVRTVARTNPVAASSVPVPARDASIRRAAALGRGPGVSAAAVRSQAAVAGPIYVEAREQLESVPVAVPPLSSEAAEQLTVPIQSSAAEGMADVAVHEAEWDDGGWPEPQNDDWGTTADLEIGHSKRQREPSAADAGDTRSERRSRSQRDSNGQRIRVEEGSDGAEDVETRRSKVALESRSRKESKSHRSDKEERKHKSRHKSRRERDPVGAPRDDARRSEKARSEAQQEMTPDVLGDEPASTSATARSGGGSDRAVPHAEPVQASDDLRSQLEARRTARLARGDL